MHALSLTMQGRAFPNIFAELAIKFSLLPGTEIPRLPAKKLTDS